MSNTFVLRSYAADAAKRSGATSFRTYLDRNDMWKFIESSKPSPAAEWAKGKEWVAWTEIIEQPNTPPKGVIIVRLSKHELAEETIPDEFVVEPITRDLWDEFNPMHVRKPAATGGGTAAPRAKSDVESPTKLVWQLADTMTGAPRAEVIAKCIELGVNKATANTQYYRWQKARAAESK